MTDDTRRDAAASRFMLDYYRTWRREVPSVEDWGEIERAILAAWAAALSDRDAHGTAEFARALALVEAIATDWKGQARGQVARRAVETLADGNAVMVAAARVRQDEQAARRERA